VFHYKVTFFAALTLKYDKVNINDDNNNNNNAKLYWNRTRRAYMREQSAKRRGEI